MKVSISYKFFMEFFRFSKTGWDLVSLINDIVGDEVTSRKALIMIDLIISQKKFNVELINKNASTFDNLLAFMTGMIEAHLECYQECFVKVMENAEKAVETNMLTENSYLNTCKTFQMLSNEATHLKSCLEIAKPKSFYVKSEYIIVLTLE